MNAPWVCCAHTPNAVWPLVYSSTILANIASLGCVIHIGVGLRVARFYLQGNAKTSMCGASDSARLHAFLCVVYRMFF